MNEQLELFDNDFPRVREFLPADWEVVPYRFICLDVLFPVSESSPTSDNSDEMSCD